MVHRRANDRRSRDSGPPNGCQERRYLAERRRMSVSDASLAEFETLMSALGFRNNRPGDPKN